MNHYKRKRLSIAIANARKYSSKSCHAVVLVSATSFATGVYAATPVEQTTGTQTAATSPADAPVATLKGVMVTANKREENAQDVAMSVSAVSSKTLIQEGTPRIEQFFTKAPGLNLSEGTGGRTDVAIRGITTGDGSYSNPVVGFTIDDAPFGGSTFVGGAASIVPNLDPLDLDHIEVLRGPQGTLYGASSLGGLIKYVTVKPDTNKFSGQFQTDGSAVDGGGTGYGLRGAVNLPIVSDTFGVRLSGFDRQDPGWVDDPRLGKTNVNAIHSRGGRISSIWYLNDDITVRSSFMQQHTNAYAGPGTDRTSSTGSAVDGEFDHERINNADGYDRTLRFFDTNVEADMGWATLTSVTSYSEIHNKYSQDLTGSFGYLVNTLVPQIGSALGYDPAEQGMRADLPTDLDKFTQELRLDSPQDGRSLDWRAGLFFNRESVSTSQDVYIADIQSGANTGAPTLYALSSNLTYKEMAAYGMTTYHFTDRFQLQSGLRVSQNKQEFTDFTGGLLSGEDSTIYSTSKQTALTYMLSPSYKFNDNLMVYGRLATGYRPGGPNSSSKVSSNIPATYDSDTTTNYELGVKGDFLNHTLTLDSALFFIDWKNIQTALTDADSGFGYMTNGGRAHSKGIENSFTWLPYDGLTVDGNLTFMDARFTEVDSSNETMHRGDRLPYSPRWSGSLSVTQNFPVFGHYDAYAGATVTYVGDRGTSFPNLASAKRYTVPAYTTVDLKSGVKINNWDVGLYVRNLFNQDAIILTGGRNTFSPDDNTFTDVRLQPRTFGMSLSTTF